MTFAAWLLDQLPYLGYAVGVYAVAMCVVAFGWNTPD
jgi:hypothetical protein